VSKEEVERDFPDLASSGYRITSEATTDFNCIAWAAHNEEVWWWPDSQYIGYWPPNVPREETLHAFILVYQSLGFIVCEDSALEEGYEKIAIYVKRGKPTHATRQLETGKWTSKLGNIEDIEHETLESISGEKYGHVAVYMKRPRKQ